ncbi:MAG: hypothetical protein VX220_10360 [Pseudomonadota bacterium]|nr:hypothetical protein [Pseudomonadota bacterium]
MYKQVIWIFLSTSLLVKGISAFAQDEYFPQWSGNWIADGTFFQIEISVKNNVMVVNQVESLGFIWTNQNGEVDGKIAQVEVEYAGATGIVIAELIEPNTAIVTASTCVPDFMVVCALAKGRQAIFRKVEEP